MLLSAPVGFQSVSERLWRKKFGKSLEVWEIIHNFAISLCVCDMARCGECLNLNVLC